MMELELIKVYAGWSRAQTPDNMRIRLWIDGTTHEMYASLRELLELYGRVLHERDGDMTIGTGQFIQLESTVLPQNGEERDEYVRVKKPPLEFLTPREELRTELESLLDEAFKAHDEANDSGRRDEQLSYIQQWLDDHDLDFDVNRFST